MLAGEQFGFTRREFQEAAPRVERKGDDQRWKRGAGKAFAVEGLFLTFFKFEVFAFLKQVDTEFPAVNRC